jgi:hypothetical protein
MLIVSDALVVCESEALRGLVKFALGRYWGIVVRGAADFDTASAALVERTPQVAINAGPEGLAWAHATTEAPFRPTKLHQALEEALS